MVSKLRIIWKRTRTSRYLQWEVGLSYADGRDTIALTQLSSRGGGGSQEGTTARSAHMDKFVVRHSSTRESLETLRRRTCCSSRDYYC